MTALLNSNRTSALLPWHELTRQIAALLADPTVQVPPRLVQPLAGGASLFVMPACDARLAMTKLITFTPANAGTGRPAIQGDVSVFDVATGERRLILDGPTVTARRTAAVSLLAAQRLAPNPDGPLLIVGAGSQGLAHLEAFAEVLGVTEARIASRSPASAQKLADHARSLGMKASVVTDVDAQLRDCPLVVTCTPADAIVLRAAPRTDAFIAAVGSFTPSMVELDPALCRHIADHGTIVIDTPAARHEAGDLLQAGLDLERFCDLRAIVLGTQPMARGPVLFKSCGWAGWDLAAARCAIDHME